MLTRSSEYALRALTYLSLQEDRTRWVLARHIAAELGIPSPFLAKILQTLAGATILESQRGRRGGFRLNRNPERLSLLEIIEPFDRLESQRLCVLGQKVCSDETACPLHHTWKHSLNSFLHRLRTTTLADLRDHPMAMGFPSRLEPPSSPSGPPNLSSMV